MGCLSLGEEFVEVAAGIFRGKIQLQFGACFHCHGSEHVKIA